MPRGLETSSPDEMAVTVQSAVGVNEGAPVPGQIVAGKFQVRRLLGAGGMGMVFEAEHLVTKRIGALKLLRKPHTQVADTVERFVREASAAGRIASPHIVETFDAGELPSGEPYIFMELLVGRSLASLLDERRQLDFETARDIVAQAALGLMAAHDAGIVHRDVKPDNLFLCDADKPFVKILDFGISKFNQTEDLRRLTRSGSALGTPYYMPPEQLGDAAEVDSRTDVYSLGVVLYECLTGQVPFDATSLEVMSARVLEGRFTPPGDLRANLPSGLDAVLARAMAVMPAARYPDMRSFHEALTLIEQPAIPAHSGRLRRWVLCGIGLACSAVVAWRVWPAASSGAVTPSAPRASAVAGSAPASPSAIRPARAATTGLAPASIELGATANSASARAAPRTGSVDATRRTVPRGPASVSPPTAARAGLRDPRLNSGHPSARPMTRAERDGLSDTNPFVSEGQP